MTDLREKVRALIFAHVRIDNHGFPPCIVGKDAATDAIMAEVSAMREVGEAARRWRDAREALLATIQNHAQGESFDEAVSNEMSAARAHLRAALSKLDQTRD